MKYSLSTRQVEVMRRLCRGLVAKEMAGEMGLSRRTVEYHLEMAKKRLHARTLAHAAAAFIRAKEKSQVVASSR